MTGFDRRSVVRLAAAVAALQVVGLSPAGAQSEARFAPSAGAMLYTRRIERGLVDGATFSVSRSFAVRFVPEAGGFRVEGEQVAVDVVAPAQLEPLVRLERERVEAGLFPLQLDAVGAIRGLPGALDSTLLDEAVREVSARIEHGDHTAAEREQLHAFVDAVHRSTGQFTAGLPRDLFAPVDGPREDRREVVLPGGAVGQVRVRFTAERDPATGLMREARREIVTEVAGDVRRTVESWSLTPLAG